MSAATLARQQCIEIVSSLTPPPFAKHPSTESEHVGLRQSASDSGEDSDADTELEGLAEARRKTFAHVSAASALRSRLATGSNTGRPDAVGGVDAVTARLDRSSLSADPASSSAVAAAHLQLDLASVLRAAAQSEPDLDYEYDDATVLSNEEDALMSRGTMHSEGALTSRLDSTGYDSSCDTEPSAKENTPEGELLSVHKHETRRKEPATISEEPNVALANISEAEDDEEWEMQALREQQEQITRDCCLLAEMEERREREAREAQEQLEMVRFLEEEALRQTEMEQMASEVIFVQQKFVLGMRVTIVRLQTHGDLNGKEAVVLELMGERVKVELGDGRQLALKSGNLQQVSSAHDHQNSIENHSRAFRPASAPPRPATSELQRPEHSSQGPSAKKGYGRMFGLKKLFGKSSSKVATLLPSHNSQEETRYGEEPEYDAKLVPAAGGRAGTNAWGSP